MRPALGTLLVFLSVAVRAFGAAPAADPIERLQHWLAGPATARSPLHGQTFAEVALTKAQAEQARRLLWEDHAAGVRAAGEQDWKAQSIAAAGQTLKWKMRQFGAKPKGGWDLYLSLHGGGGAPVAVNDQQWENQIKLYQPKDCLYIAPRGPTDHWNLWHEAHVDALFDRLLELAFVLGDVNPDRVYVMGYSAGGDGVYQLAPRMADRWAAASMMAGHPNDASPLGLRNIGFALHVGALDAAYDRNKVAAQWKVKLDDLRRADPAGYAHDVQLHEGRGHWMNLEDKTAVDWMATFTRNPLPDKVVWKQSPVTHERFYWLSVPPGGAKAGQLLTVSRKGQEFEIEQAEGVKSVAILLNDAMLNLDQPVRVIQRGKELFRGVVPRRIVDLQATLAGRGDPRLVFDAVVTVAVEEP